MNDQIYVPGQVSQLDMVLFGMKQLGSSSIVGDYDLLGVNKSSDGENRTNLPVNNQIPSQWKLFEIYEISLKLFSNVDIDDLITLARDSSYSFKVSNFEYKQGSLAEFIFPSSFYGNDQIANTAIASFASDIRQGSYVPLRRHIFIPANTTANFVVSVGGSDIAALHSKWIGVFLRGVLLQKVAG